MKRKEDFSKVKKNLETVRMIINGFSNKELKDHIRKQKYSSMLCRSETVRLLNRCLQILNEILNETEEYRKKLTEDDFRA